ncbi:hypothetical protein HF086_011989 [Spodoptera exigua]|uniref:Uncharacterized protein n=1 Tax=Spodoptera exigua TaxID=7107 RepID=A0A922MIE4_SPOEX|nr:hypothetical protein HF086_011989 [Spodoptera exigua]
MFELNKIISISQKQGQHYYQFLTSVSFIAYNLHKDTAFLLSEEDLKSCTHIPSDILLCSLNMPIYDLKMKQSICDIKIINHAHLCKSVKASCEERWIKLHRPNTWLYTCCPECQVRIICANGVTMTHLINNGIITLGQGCTLKGDTFSIYAHNNFFSNLNIHHHIEVPEVSMLNRIMKTSIPDNISMVEDHQVIWDQLRAQIDEVKEQSSTDLSIHDVHHYTVLYISVAAVIILGGVVVYLIRSRRAAAGAAASPAPRARRLLGRGRRQSRRWIRRQWRHIKRDQCLSAVKCSREILQEERSSAWETMRRENRRVAAGSVSEEPPPKPQRPSNNIPVTDNAAGGAGAAQTYIVAQNPLVLAHLLRENTARAHLPHAYTTPASVFNTVAVDFADTLPETQDIVEKIIHPRPDEKIDIPLQTAPIPAASLQKLDPIVPTSTPSDTPDETLTVVVGARESCDNLCQNIPSVSPRGDTASPSAGEADIPEPYASRVRSLERNTRGTLSTAERAPIRMGSLERNARGSLSHRGSPVPIAPFTRQHSVPASPPPRTRRDQDVGQFAVQGALNAQLAASVMNKMRTQPDPPLVEEIYDFGGDNVKSCVAVAAQRAMARPQFRRESSMAASHPSASYGVPVGVVQGVPYSGQARPSKVPQGFLRSASPQPFQQAQQGFAQPMGVVPPMYGAQQVYPGRSP